MNSVKIDPKGVKRKTGFSEKRNMVGAKKSSHHHCWLLSIFEVDFREDLRFLHRYLTVSRCEHEVLSDQGPPADQPAPELQWGHVRTWVGGRFSAINNVRTFNAWKTNMTFMTLLNKKRWGGFRSDILPSQIKSSSRARLKRVMVTVHSYSFLLSLISSGVPPCIICGFYCITGVTKGILQKRVSQLVQPILNGY